MWYEFLIKLYQQLILVFFSVSVATVIGITLGCILFLNRKMASIGHSIVQIIWTIPSLALLTLMIPFAGIGNKPAVIALTLYTLLPILQNTLNGLQLADPTLDEAARSFGLNRWQRLFRIEMPQASSLIISGIRMATVMAVGMATLAAFIGAGGLGDFINQGLAMNNNQLVLIGASGVALLALMLDFSVRRLQSFLTIDKPYFKLKLSVALIIFVGLMAYTTSQMISVCSNAVIRIGTKNTTEQLILGELIAQTLQTKTNLRIEKKFAFGTTTFLQQAMLQHSIDLYPEYTGTAYLNILKRQDRPDAEIIYQRVKNYYEQHYQMTWLKPFGFNNSEIMVMQKDNAHNYGINNLSQLGRWPKHFVMGASPEFNHRADGMPGLKQSYGLSFSTIKEMELTLLCRALSKHEVDLILAATTDSCILDPNFIGLQDDKHFFPSYQAAIVVQQDLLARHPELMSALSILSGKIDDITMQRLNYAVEIEHHSPAEVAKEFLQEKKLIE